MNNFILDIKLIYKIFSLNSVAFDYTIFFNNKKNNTIYFFSFYHIKVFTIEYF